MIDEVLGMGQSGLTAVFGMNVGVRMREMDHGTTLREFNELAPHPKSMLASNI